MLQDPYGGPNYFPLDSNAQYDIHITNDGDADEDITFRFQVETEFKPIKLPVGDESVDIPLVNAGPFGGELGEDALTPTLTYSLRLIRGNVNDPDSIEFVTNVVGGATRFGMPFDNIGGKSIPDYDAYANSFIHDITIPGCEPGGRVFVGQRKESFAVNLGEIFDLVNLNPIGNPDAVRSDTADKNVTSFALEVPTDCLTGDGSGIIGGWMTASMRRNRTLLYNPTFGAPDEHSGSFIQVSRLGNPLVNEVAIGLSDKNLFNASHPRDDGSNFLKYVTYPTLPEHLEDLFPGALEAPNNFPRGDLVETFLTGIGGINQDGSTGEFIRLNTSIAPAPRGLQNRLGVIGGDLAGYPNGRRPGDDAVDISLRLQMGALCHQAGGGSSNDFVATLNGQNVVPPNNSTRTGECTGTLNENGLNVLCNHNVPNVFQGLYREGAPGVNGDIIDRDSFGPSPVGWDDVPLTPALEKLLREGNTYLTLLTLNFPGGEVRGQLLPRSGRVCAPGDAPSGLLPLTDGALQNASQFGDAFPYLTTPIRGAPNEGRSFHANLIDDNLELAEPFVPTDARGFCELTPLPESLQFKFTCNYNLLDTLAAKITRDSPDGEILLLLDLTRDRPSSTFTRFVNRNDALLGDPVNFNFWATLEGDQTKIGGQFR